MTPKRIGLAVAVALAMSVIPIVLEQEFGEAAPESETLSTSADNGRRSGDPDASAVPDWRTTRLSGGPSPGETAPLPTAAPTQAPQAADSKQTSVSTDPAGQVVKGSPPIPGVVFQAYKDAAVRMKKADAGCSLSWDMLAGIGKVESGHAGGGRVTERGDTTRRILGPVLDGTRYAAIPDTDGGRLDGDSVWDRAVGPMQFIPSSWARFASDGNDDGIANPHNVFDAALATAKYLCLGERDLSQPTHLVQAIFSYNHSATYVRTVSAWIEYYRKNGADVTSTPGGPDGLPSPPAPGPSPTGEPSPSPTGEPSPSPTGAPAPAPTGAPTNAPNPSPGPTSTDAPVPSPTGTARPGPYPSPTPWPTATSTPTRVPTPTPTPTRKPTPTPAPTPSPSPTWCPLDPLPLCF
ncbi:lytic transglycosylase domain-containing protein [Actinopolymorpha alba]|uniref:lytic transglycosylase domain-containing protein n=1 Tax=Actinopolymorpha alba TaxID=533267 RepID=UPI0003A49677|nr:lytic murein transglycosylase [Actinopolymorpha alba]